LPILHSVKASAFVADKDNNKLLIFYHATLWLEHYQSWHPIPSTQYFGSYQNQYPTSLLIPDVPSWFQYLYKRKLV